MRSLLKIFAFMTFVPLMVTQGESCARQSTDSFDAGESVAYDSVGSGDILIGKPRGGTYLLIENPEAAVGYMKKSGHWDEYSQGILPQMAYDEFEYAVKLLNNHHDGFIVVDKERMKVLLFNKFGKEEKNYGMACAKNFGTKHKRSDSRTPEGFFSVKKIHNSTEWHYVDDNGVKSNKKGEFGPRFIRLNIPGTNQIGIHGTCAPWSIGGRRSHGCIRVENDNILELVNLVDSGMPVIITPGRRDIKVNREEGYEIPSISTVPGRRPLPYRLVPQAVEEIEKPDTSIVSIESVDSVSSPADGSEESVEYLENQ